MRWRAILTIVVLLTAVTALACGNKPVNGNNTSSVMKPDTCSQVEGGKPGIVEILYQISLIVDRLA